MGKTQKLVIYCALVNIVGGLLFGYAIGFVPIYTTFNTFNTDCTKLTGESACTSVKHANCVWKAPNATAAPSCLFSNYKTAPCQSKYTEESCAAVSGCTFDYAHSRCDHSPDWSPAMTGGFAGAMIIGGMIGSLVAAKIIAALGTKRSILLTAGLTLIAGIVVSVARETGNFWLLLIGRVLLGIGCGVACVVCPMYVGDMTPEAYQGPIGVLFQVACTFGIFLASAMGIILEPHDFSVDMKMELRFQILNGVGLLVSLLLIPVGIIIPPSDKEGAEKDATGTETEQMVTPKKVNGGNTSPTYDDDETLSWGDLAVPIIASVALCSAQQLTGINAVMNYAPTITKAAGLPPLLGNFCVMLWNFVTTLVSIPLSKRLSPRTLFLGGCCIASLACGVTGIAVFPSIIADPLAKHLIAGIGVLVFIAAFEIGMGSSFWIHAQALFPGKYRGPGCSFTLVVQFIWNIIINFGFPGTVVALSGGPSKNQDHGLALVFIIFFAFGAVSVAVMFKTLYPANERKKEAALEAA